MKRFRVISMTAIMIMLIGCDVGNNRMLPSSSNPTPMYSDTEGKFYIAALGTDGDQDLEFQKAFDRNIEILTGYYLTGSPSENELRSLNIKDIPMYVIFDTKREVYRTGNINEVNEYLTSFVESTDAK